MPIVAQSTKNLTAREERNALIVDDNQISENTGNSAKDLLERFKRPIQIYSSLLGTPQQYPLTFSNPLSITNANHIQQSIRRHLGGAFTEIAKLLNWRDGWNTYNAPKPEYSSIIHAAQFLIDFFQEVSYLGWTEPNVTGGPEGEVVFEWWYDQKKLTIYVQSNNLEYIQVWSKDVDAEITDGDIESTNEYLPLWMWLISK